MTLALPLEPAANFCRQRCLKSGVAQQALDSEVGSVMKKKDRISEREYHERLNSLLKSAFNTQVRPLRSLETATKKRRALKKKAVKDSGFTKSSRTASG